MYDESWAERLYRGFARNLTRPFRFVVFVDRERAFAESAIEQELLPGGEMPSYASCIEPYRLDAPMILVGLDTVVTGSCDMLAAYCETPGARLAVPRDPYFPDRVCNGVALVPAGLRAQVYERKRELHAREMSDMDWIRAQNPAVLDDLFPGACESYKGYVKHFGVGPETRIVYFHGQEKPHELRGDAWIDEHWR